MMKSDLPEEGSEELGGVKGKKGGPCTFCVLPPSSWGKYIYLFYMPPISLSREILGGFQWRKTDIQALKGLKLRGFFSFFLTPCNALHQGRVRATERSSSVNWPDGLPEAYVEFAAGNCSLRPERNIKG